MNDQVLHIAIDVSLGEDQIYRPMRDGARQQTTFCGWLGLIGRLDEMLSSASRPIVANGDRTPHQEEQ